MNDCCTLSAHPQASCTLQEREREREKAKERESEGGRKKEREMVMVMVTVGGPSLEPTDCTRELAT